MSKVSIPFVIILLIVMPVQFLTGQSVSDSSLRIREKQYNEYDRLMKTMSERTWLNLVRVNQKAEEVILTDNVLINQFLLNEIEQNKKRQSEINKLKAEIIFFKREAEIQSVLIEERKLLIRILLIIAVVSNLLFIIFLVLFIDRQTKYGSTKNELERYLSSKNEIHKDTGLNDRIVRSNKEITKLNEIRKKLESQVEDLKKQIQEKDEMISKEIKSRSVIEKEIKGLIAMIKNH